MDDERTYRNHMAIMDRAFPDWEPVWRDLPGLQTWMARMRILLPLPNRPVLPPEVVTVPVDAVGASPTKTAPTPAAESIVYFIRVSDLIKIGQTTNLRSRVRALSVTLDQVVATEPGRKGREAELHRRFAHLREFGEWFRAEPDLLEYIAALEAKASA